MVGDLLWVLEYGNELGNWDGYGWIVVEWRRIRDKWVVADESGVGGHVIFVGSTGCIYREGRAIRYIS
jgi:hypothetical protein